MRKEQQELNELRVDFSCATAIPYRFTVARPESKDKTLIDVYRDHLCLSWPGTREIPQWFNRKMSIKAAIDGQLLSSGGYLNTSMARSDGCLSGLVYSWWRNWGNIKCKIMLELELIGTRDALLGRVKMTNTDDSPHSFGIRCTTSESEVEKKATDHLTVPASKKDEGDQEVLLLGIGTSQIPTEYCNPNKGLALTWNLEPDQTQTGWIVFPYPDNKTNVSAFRDKDWAEEFADAKKEWHDLLDRAVHIKIPDSDIQKAFYACLADILLMRDRVEGPDGKEYIAGQCGTDKYRFPNSHEPSFAAVALDCSGLHHEAENGFQWNLVVQQQDGRWDEAWRADDGNWFDNNGYWLKPGNHLYMAGMKSWAVIEHYRITGDNKYLADIYPRMVASSKWQDQERSKTRILKNGKQIVGYGLLGNGICDCGLPPDPKGQYQYIPYNVWAVYGDLCTMEAAEILGKTEDLPDLKKIYQHGLKDLMQCIKESCIQEDGYCWIPSLPGEKNNDQHGWRWGTLHALWPCGLLSKDDEMITGTMHDFEKYMRNGTNRWTAITLDHLAQAHLVCNNGDEFVKSLYAVLNHGTPLLTWCEERGPEPGNTRPRNIIRLTGDLHHSYTPINIVQAIRNALIMEDGEGLQLARGTARQWLASGKPLGIEQAPSHFGETSFEMRYYAEKSCVIGEVTFCDGREPAWAIMNIRLPDGLKVKNVNLESGATILPDGEGIRWEKPTGTVHFEAEIE